MRSSALPAAAQSWSSPSSVSTGSERSALASCLHAFTPVLLSMPPDIPEVLYMHRIRTLNQDPERPYAETS